MAHSFDLLREARVIDPELASALIRMVGFRNVLSHRYENLDYRIVGDVLQHRLRDLESLALALEGSC